MPEELEYRPKVALGLGLAAVFAATAVVLVWVGTILGPSDVGAMDGLTLLLFTAVPIRLFSWACAGLFLALGVRVLRRSFSNTPTLGISQAALLLPTGERISWSQVGAVDVTQNGLLSIELEPDRAQTMIGPEESGWFRRVRRRKKGKQIALSSFELGANPVDVAAELGRRKAQASEDDLNREESN